VTDEPLSPGHRWAITVAVMLVTVMQIIDTSVTNVVLPHLQGSLSAGVEEVAWVVTLLVPLMRRIRTEPLVAEARHPERVEELRPTRASP
jgi:hypothetical protein